MPDIDIDFFDRQQALEHFTHIRASRLDKENLVPHNTGIYVTAIPHNPVTKLSNIEYTQAEDLGYFKLSLIHI